MRDSKNKESQTNIHGKAKWYRKKIIDMANAIEDVWILEVIHNFIRGMTKEGD